MLDNSLGIDTLIIILLKVCKYSCAIASHSVMHVILFTYSRQFVASNKLLFCDIKKLHAVLLVVCSKLPD